MHTAEFIAPTAALRDAAGRVAAYVEAIPPPRWGAPTWAHSPVLGDFLITVEAGGVTVLASNHKVAGAVTFAAEVIGKGRFVVDRERFTALVRALPGEEVHVHDSGSQILVEPALSPLPAPPVKPIRYEVMTMPQDEFPGLEVIPVPVDPKVQPARPSGREKAVAAPERAAARLREPWKATRTRSLYSPEPLAAGSWVEVSIGDGMVAAGQVWVEAGRDGKRGWVVVPGLDGNTAVETRCGYKGVETLDGCRVVPCGAVVAEQLKL